MLAPRMPIAIIRLADLSQAVPLAQALVNGGLTAIEFTLTNNDALGAIEAARAALGDAASIGAGTILTAQQAHDAIAAGAQFLVTPTVRKDVVGEGRAQNTPVICGAFTPSEILDAWQAGAPMIKVFPVRSLGPSFIKDVLGPLPDLKLVPTGGVDLTNCAAYIRAGAYTVGIGGGVVDPRLIAAQDWVQIAQRARSFVEACASV
ncbi:bifunctional 4-hydroxy-2-oxoglutarate aldolase/2-dehydro-3-deoxy-phosphogluconate aldolase [Chloroflexia bacterium SDU3-3]|nr:bifunctional 4-hydroxy-2-oxoglutarate aldolase/2-dehydro-3-deoxy-phosphogluconate aldolase [Chloroflexia bacterium SDU3-3]